jgi:hypothetical protein
VIAAHPIKPNPQQSLLHMELDEHPKYGTSSEKNTSKVGRLNHQNAYTRLIIPQSSNNSHYKSIDNSSSSENQTNNSDISTLADRLCPRRL